MAVMRRDINIGLLFLIVATLIVFAGFTVYYQTTFKNVSNEYKTKLTELEKVSSDLESKKKELTETSQTLQLKESNEQALSSQYTDLKGEKDQLEKDKATLQIELAAKLSELVDTQNALQAEKAKSDQLLQNIVVLNRKLDSLADEKSCLESTADADEGSC